VDAQDGMPQGGSGKRTPMVVALGRKRVEYLLQPQNIRIITHAIYIYLKKQVYLLMSYGSCILE
jgi:hypothetical protein